MDVAPLRRSGQTRVGPLAARPRTPSNCPRRSAGSRSTAVLREGRGPRVRHAPRKP